VVNLKQTLREIKKIVAERDVSKIVVGMPFHLKGTVGQTAQQVEAFIEALERRVDVPIQKWDERFSSIAAEKIIREMGKSPHRHRDKIDQIAALLILQSYLDYLNSKKKS